MIEMHDRRRIANCRRDVPDIVVQAPNGDRHIPCRPNGSDLAPRPEDKDFSRLAALFGVQDPTLREDAQL